MTSTSTPKVRDYMTVAVHTIGRDQTLEQAHRLMRTFKIRHLPVLEGGKLVGIVSLRDLNLIETLRDVDPAEVSVEDAMTEDIYVVSAETSLREVAAEMEKRKLGSAVVMHAERVVGVLTTIDALRALVDVLQDTPASDMKYEEVRS
jgi:acetoin utilization protein AcuB